MIINDRILDLAGQPTHYDIAKKLAEDVNLNDSILTEGFIDTIRSFVTAGNLKRAIAIGLIASTLNISELEAKEKLEQTTETNKIEQVQKKDILKNIWFYNKKISIKTLSALDKKLADKIMKNKDKIPYDALLIHSAVEPLKMVKSRTAKIANKSPYGVGVEKFKYSFIRGITKAVSGFNYNKVPDIKKSTTRD